MKIFPNPCERDRAEARAESLDIVIDLLDELLTELEQGDCMDGWHETVLDMQKAAFDEMQENDAILYSYEVADAEAMNREYLADRI